jgi:formylglycine-generating enzyme required for sulfatase activity/tRNA A-37 threonylcarbamoyl transferase component Bud32
MTLAEVQPPEIPGLEWLRPLGSGAAANVYLARELESDGLVAVKVLAPHGRGTKIDTNAWKRFEREAEIMSRVRHPNIVSINRFGSADGLPYLVMEYVPGSDLRAVMPEGSPWSLPRIRELAAPLILALDRIHADGIVHRDIKPENILLDHRLVPKLTDFGVSMLSALDSPLTGSRTWIGTLIYAAPEQRYRLKVDARADQYGLSAVLYELLTGHPPLGAFGKPSSFVASIGAPIDDVIMKGLEADPHDRFPSILEFGRALDEALATPVKAVRLLNCEPPTIDADTQHTLPLAKGELEGVLRSRPPSPIRPSQPESRTTPIQEQSPIRIESPVPPTASRRVSLTVGSLAALAAITFFLFWSSGLVGKPDRRVPRDPNRGATASASPPTTAREPLPESFVNGLQMELRLVPAGEYFRGSSPADPLAEPDELPDHLVRITKPFYLGIHEVTRREFQQFAAAGHDTDAERQGGGHVFDRPRGRLLTDPDINWRQPGYADTYSDDEPVVQVSWKDAIAFCGWLQMREGRIYRLPTEAEWEYACRAGGHTHWSMGDDPADLDRFAWTTRNAGDTPHRVGTKAQNAFGLYDMHGNVWEWCLDTYAPYTLHAASGAILDPLAAAPGPTHVLKGGSYDWDKLGDTRSAARIDAYPTYRCNSYGFRVCVEIP